MSDYTKAEMEMGFVRMLSTGGNQIGKTQEGNERRERVRAALFRSSRQGERFLDTSMTCAEAFRECYGEAIDRRSVPRELPEDNDEDELLDIPDFLRRHRD